MKKIDSCNPGSKCDSRLKLHFLPDKTNKAIFGIFRKPNFWNCPSGFRCDIILSRPNLVATFCCCLNNYLLVWSTKNMEYTASGGAPRRSGRLLKRQGKTFNHTFCQILLIFFFCNQNPRKNKRTRSICRQPRSQRWSQIRRVNKGTSWRMWLRIRLTWSIICDYSCDYSDRKALGATCEILYEVCIQSVLCLDFDQIQNESGKFPLVSRAYRAVRLTGNKIRGTDRQFNSVLQSSQKTVNTIFIGETPRALPEYLNRWYTPNLREVGSQIAFTRLQFLLEYFPNLESVFIKGVATKIGKSNQLKVLKLPKLKKIRLELINNDVLLAIGPVRRCLFISR